MQLNGMLLPDLFWRRHVVVTLTESWRLQAAASMTTGSSSAFLLSEAEPTPDQSAAMHLLAPSHSATSLVRSASTGGGGSPSKPMATLWHTEASSDGMHYSRFIALSQCIIASIRGDHQSHCPPDPSSDPQHAPCP